MTYTNSNSELNDRNEYNILVNVLNPIKHENSKDIHFLPIIQVSMNTCSVK